MAVDRARKGRESRAERHRRQAQQTAQLEAPAAGHRPLTLAPPALVDAHSGASERLLSCQAVDTGSAVWEAMEEREKARHGERERQRRLREKALQRRELEEATS